MMSIEEFIEFKYDSYRSSELSTTGLSTILSLPTITGFVAYGVTAGALLLAPYFTFTGYAFVTPVFVASLIGGTLGLLAGALTVLVIIPALAFYLRMLVDCVINGDFTYQLLMHSATVAVHDEIEKLKEIYSSLQSLAQHGLIDYDQPALLGEKTKLTPLQKEIYSHIDELETNFTSAESDMSYKHNQHLLDLQNARINEHFLASRASLYNAMYPKKGAPTDERLKLLKTSPGFHLLDLVYYVASFMSDSVDFRTHPGHLKINFGAVGEVKSSPLYLRFADDPIKTLLSMTIEEVLDCKRRMIETDARYQVMSPRRLQATLAASKPQSTTYRYCQLINQSTQLWAATKLNDDTSLADLPKPELEAYRDQLKASLPLAPAYEQYQMSLSIKRLQNMIDEFDLDESAFTVTPSH